MKQSNMKMWILFLLLVATLVTPTFGILIVGDAVIQDPEIMNWDYEIYLSQSSIGLFTLWVTALDNDVFQFDARGIAEYYAVYDVDFETVLNPDFMASTRVRSHELTICEE